jgi:type 1 glutamine amidotransferase
MRYLIRVSSLLMIGSMMLLPATAVAAGQQAAHKKIVFIAGKPSHGYAQHEHYPGCVVLAKWIKAAVPGVETIVYNTEWPKDEKAFDGVDAIVLFSDGGAGNPLMPHLEQLQKLMKKGVGLACLHYAVEIPEGESGDLLKDWIGGYFESFWSVNPHWKADFKQFPKHPVTNGVKPFAIDDEWYYHMRFMDNMEGVAPILTAIPPDSTRERPDGAHSNNPTVRSQKGAPEHLAWVRMRPDGGRGFGFTGGHWHYNWANDSFRTLVLNGIAWVAKIDIPAGGISSKTPTLDELLAGVDKPVAKNFVREKVAELLEEWKQQSTAK